MCPGFSEDAQRVHRRGKRDERGCKRDGQGMHKGCKGEAGGCRRMQKGPVVEAQELQGSCMKDARRVHRAGRRGAGTFEDVIREQSGHLLIPLLHGKQDCEGERSCEPGPAAPQIPLFPPKPAPQLPYNSPIEFMQQAWERPNKKEFHPQSANPWQCRMGDLPPNQQWYKEQKLRGGAGCKPAVLQ